MRDDASEFDEACERVLDALHRDWGRAPAEPVEEQDRDTAPPSNTEPSQSQPHNAPVPAASPALPSAEEQASRTASETPFPEPQEGQEAPGDFIDSRYELVRELKGGGQGTVWEARDVRTQRKIAIKLLKVGPHHEWRASREPSLLRDLNHEHIVEIRDIRASSKQGRPYIAYEFIEGHDLRRQIETELPSIEQAAAWCRDIARAMQHAHEQGVIHRDLKPDNVMLQISSNKIKVIDFGLGRSLTPLGHDDNSLSNEFHFVGTRRWAAPEQFREKATFASDIYLIGSILYYSLTRQAPSDPTIMPSPQPADLNTTTELLEPSTGEPGSINQIRRAIGAPEISSILENICLQALQHKPSDRQTNAKELADQLDQFLGVNQNFNPRQVTKRKLGVVRKSVAITTLCLLPAILFFATLTVARRLDESHDRKQGFSRLSTQEFKVLYGSLGAIKETGFIPWLRTGITEIKPEGITLIEFKATPFEYREKAIKSFTLSLEIRPHGDDPKFGIFLGSRNLSEKHKQQHVIFLDRLREQGQSPIEEPKLLVAYHRLARLELTLTDEGEELRRIPGQENHQEEFQFPCQTANYWIPLECTVAANHVTSLVIDGRDCLNIINENLLKEWPISPANEQNQIVHGLFVWAAGTDGCEVRNVKRKIVYQE